MVRFHWHGQDACVAFVPVKGVQPCDGPVQHIQVEMDVPGVAGSASALLSVPAGSLNGVATEGSRSVGVVIAHDTDPNSWKGELLTALTQVCCGPRSGAQTQCIAYQHPTCLCVPLAALRDRMAESAFATCKGPPVLPPAAPLGITEKHTQTLVREGFAVMRNHSDNKELRRLKLFDKAIDAAASSPYTAHVKSWILLGLGNGARIAATCTTRVKVPISGLVLLSYPLLEATPPLGRGGGHQDSTRQVAGAAVPIAFVHAARDEECRAAALAEFCARCASASQSTAGAGGARLVVVPDCDASFSRGKRGADGSHGSCAAILQVRARPLYI